jgi:hypothetical protein
LTHCGYDGLGLREPGFRIEVRRRQDEDARDVRECCRRRADQALGIQELLDHGQLIDLFRDWPDERFRLYALYPSRHLPAAKVRAFIDFVMAAVGPKSGRPL